MKKQDEDLMNQLKDFEEIPELVFRHVNEMLLSIRH